MESNTYCRYIAIYRGYYPVTSEKGRMGRTAKGVYGKRGLAPIDIHNDRRLVHAKRLSVGLTFVQITR